MANSIKLIEKFGAVSGMTLNCGKCEGLWIGNQKFRQINCKTACIKWPTKPIRYLGIYIGHDREACHHLNWQMKIDDLGKTLNSWQHRDLTLFGKIHLRKKLRTVHIII